MTPRPSLFLRDLFGALVILTWALGLLLSAVVTCVLCSPYLLGRWLWCKSTGRPW